MSYVNDNDDDEDDNDDDDEGEEKEEEEEGKNMKNWNVCFFLKKFKTRLGVWLIAPSK